MTRVYAIHTGSYSDQSWGPVFSTPERAIEYKTKSRDLEMEIETHVLDDANDTGPVYPSWWVVFDREGNVLGLDIEGEPEPYEPLLHHAGVKRIPPKCGWYMLDHLQRSGKLPDRSLAHILVRCKAVDSDHAIKIASDARFQYIALWGKGV